MKATKITIENNEMPYTISGSVFGSNMEGLYFDSVDGEINFDCRRESDRFNSLSEAVDAAGQLLEQAKAIGIYRAGAVHVKLWDGGQDAELTIETYTFKNH